MNSIIERKEHVSDEVLELFFKEELNQKDYMQVLEHISTCDFCSQRYTRFVEEDLLELPIGFREDTLGKSESIHVVTVNLKKQFYSYCFRVGFACAASIALLFSFNTMRFDAFIVKLHARDQVSISQIVEEKWDSVKKMIDNKEEKDNVKKEK